MYHEDPTLTLFCHTSSSLHDMAKFGKPLNVQTVAREGNYAGLPVTESNIGM